MDTILAQLQEVDGSGTSKQYQNAIINKLFTLGALDLEMERPTNYMGAGEVWRNGRVDVSFRVGDKTYALELDRLTPRRKSVFKLRAIKDADVKAVLLRDQPIGSRVVLVA